MTVFDLTLLLSHFPPDAEVAELSQVPGTEAILLRVELPNPTNPRVHRVCDWFDDEVTEVDPSAPPSEE